MMKRSWIESFSESIGLIPKISDRPDWSEEFAMEGPRELYKYPDPSEWDDFTELDPAAWPEKKEKHYSIVPTTCFNCESACGLLAYIDKDSDEVRKFDGLANGEKASGNASPGIKLWMKFLKKLPHPSEKEKMVWFIMWGARDTKAMQSVS